MRRKKKARKKEPFHVVHEYERFELESGTIFWAKDEKDAELYKLKVKQHNEAS